MLPLLRRFDLGPTPRRMRGFAGNAMAIADSVLRCAVFIGHGDEPTFKAVGTGFLLAYDNCRYLVTARHVAHNLGDDPFAIRLNKAGSGSDVLHCDFHDPETHPWFRWHVPIDDSVDLAIIPFQFDLKGAGYNSLLLRFEDHHFALAKVPIFYALGDTCHAVGLFRYAQGATRNIPIVHTGNLAMLSSNERILASHWDASRGKTLEMSAHLVEFANLDGLSGAPVFVRPSLHIGDFPVGDGLKESVEITFNRLWLLGVWQGSWERTEVVGNFTERRPAGIGVVTPAEQLQTLLEQDDVKQGREAYFADRRYTDAARLDGSEGD